MFYLRGKKRNRHKYKQYHGKYVHALETHWLSVNGLNSIYIYIIEHYLLIYNKCSGSKRTHQEQNILTCGIKADRCVYLRFQITFLLKQFLSQTSFNCMLLSPSRQQTSKNNVTLLIYVQCQLQAQRDKAKHVWRKVKSHYTLYEERTNALVIIYVVLITHTCFGSLLLPSSGCTVLKRTIKSCVWRICPLLYYKML
jgi:hypothetical protein